MTTNSDFLTIARSIVTECAYDAHLDQFGPQSGGWGSATQLQGMHMLGGGANRTLFIEPVEDGTSATESRDYEDHPGEFLHIARMVRNELMPQQLPESWRMGRDFHLTIEGWECWTGDESNEKISDEIKFYHGFGVRGTNPIYHKSNPIGDCSHLTGRRFNGLSKFGADLIFMLMTIRGWWVDLAHMSYESMAQTIDQAGIISGRVCYTHGGIWHEGVTNELIANGNRERCISWEMVERVIVSGGIICPSPARPFYDDPEVYFQHVIRLGEMSNWEGVGVGTDYGGILDEWCWPGCESVDQVFLFVAQELLQCGVSEDNVRKVIGQNARRFFHKE